jgi:hypothetical protein
MNLELLFRISDKVRSRGRLSPEERRFVAVTVPDDFAAFPDVDWPAKLRHPAGFTLSGAVVRTFAKCAIVTAAHGALGPRNGGGSPFHDRVEERLALEIMHSHFERGFPRGVHCCVQCTLAVLPVLAGGYIRWFDGRALAPSVRELIESRQWRFANFRNGGMIAWSLHGAAR